jgi:hypothetical protein
MRVDYLFIIGIVAENPASSTERMVKKDTEECMAALFAKYAARSKSTMSLFFEYPSGYSAASDWEAEPKTYMQQGADLRGSTKKINNNLNGGLVPYGFAPDELNGISPNERIGIYLIGNYVREEGVLECMMVEPVARMIKNLGLPKIDKLCLVACGAARVGTSSKDNKKFPNVTQNANEKCFVYTLCRALAPLTPKIAGWDGYVEVSTPEHQKGSTGSKFTGEGVNKRVIQFVDGAPRWQLNNAGWSDRA